MVASRFRFELLVGIYAALVCNLLMAAVLNNPLEASLRTWLVTLGVGNEIVGVILIASPELIPVAQAVGRLPARFIRYLDLLVWRLRGGTRPVGNSLRMGYDIGTAHDRAQVTRRPDDDATLEARVEFLLEEVRQLNFEVHNLDTRIREMPKFWRDEIEQAQAGAVERARELVRGLEERNLGLRLLGVGFVVLGLVLSGSGNLV